MFEKCGRLLYLYTAVDYREMYVNRASFAGFLFTCDDLRGCRSNLLSRPFGSGMNIFQKVLFLTNVSFVCVAYCYLRCTSIIIVCTRPKRALGGKVCSLLGSSLVPAINFPNSAMCAWKSNWWQDVVSKSKSDFSL